MKIQIKILIGIIILSLFEHAGALSPSSYKGVILKSIRNCTCYDDLDKETDRFLKAKEYVFKRQWKKAKVRLEAYLKAYPSGHYRGEAYFWLARCLDKLSNNARSLEEVLEMKQKAASGLDILIKEYPKSLWKDDAQSLRIVIAGQLYFMGKRDQKKEIMEILNTKGIKDGKLFYWDVLLELKSDVALSVLGVMLKESKDDPDVRKEIVIFLGTHFPDKAMDILPDLASEDPDENVRDAALVMIDKIQMSMIPVQLNYFCYSSKLKNKDEWKHLPEGKINVIDLPCSKKGSIKQVEKALKRFFNNKLSDMKMACSSRGGLGSSQLKYAYKIDYQISGDLKVNQKIEDEIEEGQEINYDSAENLKKYDFSDSYMFTISHNVAGFQISPFNEDLIKGYEEISGRFRFLDKSKGKEYIASYTVDEEYDKLLAIRKGDNVAIVVLQFESEEEDEKEEKPVYYTKFSDILGCQVSSSRRSWSVEEMSKINGVINYSKAIAEIPDKKGKWKLIGNLMSDGKNRQFIGRNAVLYNPKRQIVAEAAEIIVPVDHPEMYEVAGKKVK